MSDIAGEFCGQRQPHAAHTWNRVLFANGTIPYSVFAHCAGLSVSRQAIGDARTYPHLQGAPSQPLDGLQALPEPGDVEPEEEIKNVDGGCEE